MRHWTYFILIYLILFYLILRPITIHYLTLYLLQTGRESPVPPKCMSPKRRTEIYNIDGWPSTQPGSLHTALQRKYTQPCSLFSRCRRSSSTQEQRYPPPLPLGATAPPTCGRRKSDPGLGVTTQDQEYPCTTQAARNKGYKPNRWLFVCNILYEYITTFQEQALQIMTQKILI